MSSQQFRILISECIRIYLRIDSIASAKNIGLCVVPKGIAFSSISLDPDKQALYFLLPILPSAFLGKLTSLLTLLQM
ncbi:MAG: hypothetical protein EZS28_034629 [Streblomastix strix]|uniref:Uncharacterized protein n=1 Tax=Streblomastix strix TaxID=222440 RepID=A0A5J4UJN3_9EUKA|nr:MAG: hypothetical protein EZS28_034629 [Streblomastix strix]